MDQQGRSRDDELARELADLKNHIGGCPDQQQLNDFISGILPAEEQQALARHIALCGLCDLKASRSGLFVSAEEWTGIEARLKQPLTAGEPSRTPDILTRVFGVLRHPALGYAIALVLCIPAYRGLVKKDAPSALAPPTLRQPAPTQGLTALNIVELPERKRGAAPEAADVHIRSDDRVIGLAFYLPDRTQSGWRYNAEIVKTSGAPVTASVPIRSRDGLGSFLLALGTELLIPGKYDLVVRETGPDGAEPIEIRFPFEVR